MRAQHINENKKEFTHSLLKWLNSKKDTLIRLRGNSYWYIIDLMIIKHNCFYKLYVEECKKSIMDEIKIANILKTDKVLHIGCGPYPITAIILKELSGASIVAIDKRYNATKLANEYIRKHEISDIKVECGNAINYNVKDFDLIVLTSTVTPRIEVLNNILKNSKKDCRFICREENFTEKSIEKIIRDSEWHIKKKIQHKGKWASYLIIKE